MYQRILCPIDGSDASGDGLEEAIKFAREQKATIKLLHIIDKDCLQGREGMIENIGEQLLKRGLRILETAQARAASAGVSVQTALCDRTGGSIADEIIENCRLWDAELIVMGMQGWRGTGDTFIGKDAGSVIQRSKVPVLLVKGNKYSRQQIIISATRQYDASDALFHYTSVRLPHTSIDRHIPIIN